MILATPIFNVQLSVRGSLFLSARPRGGDWLKDEITDWQQQEIDLVVSLLTAHEEVELELQRESAEVKKHGMQFVSFPIEDRRTPQSTPELLKLIESLRSSLDVGRKILIHCRQGVGRTGLVAACILITYGMNTMEALSLLTSARGLDVPETPEQLEWVKRFASSEE